MYNSTRPSQQSAKPAQAASSDAEVSSLRHLAVFFDAQGRVRFEFLYRGDNRPPSEIFSEGFFARGENTTLRDHVLPANAAHWCVDSGFISTSHSSAVAASFPRELRNGTGFLFVINPQSNARDVPMELKGDADRGLIDADDFRYTVQHEAEMAVPEKIKPQDIKSAWRISVSEVSGVRRHIVHLNEQPIRNPLYQVPTHPVLTAAKTIKILGSVTTAVAAYFDLERLFRAFVKAEEENQPSIFFREAATVATAWSTACVVGLSASKTAGAACAPLGPGAALACAVAVGVAGSAVGYIAGEQVAEVVSGYQRSARPQSQVAQRASLFSAPAPAPTRARVVK